jgi:hypothetical protein
MISLEPIYGLPTQRVMAGNLCVGYLYAPVDETDKWELWARPQYRGTDWLESFYALVDTKQCRRFSTEAAALKALGVTSELNVLAA